VSVSLALDCSLQVQERAVEVGMKLHPHSACPAEGQGAQRSPTRSWTDGSAAVAVGCGLQKDCCFQAHFRQYPGERGMTQNPSGERKPLGLVCVRRSLFPHR